MKKSNGVALILNYKRQSTYAFNVVVGALESWPGSDGVEMSFVSEREALVSAIQGARQQDKTVVVAWSFYSPTFLASATELQAVKQEVAHPDIIHLAGGVHATAEPRQTLSAGFDFVATGEGEKTIIDFVGRLVRGEDHLATRGVSYLDGVRYISNGQGERIDLNEYPPFAQKHRKFNPIEITRGCIYACKFCQTPFMFKAKFRHRSVENVCHHVQVMKDHGLKDVRFITPTSLSYGSDDGSVRPDKIEELLSSIRRVLGNTGKIFFGTFPSEVRPEHCTHETLGLLKRYVANDNLIIGGQSGSDRILASSHRGHDVHSVVAAVRIALEVGFLPNVDFIFGLPGETPADTKASLRLAEHLSDMGAKIHGHTFMPLPGTPWKNAPPGILKPATLHQLKRLVSRGKLYGLWQEQVAIADELHRIATVASRRDEGQTLPIH